MGYRNEQSNSLCWKHYKAITAFHPPLKREFTNNIMDVETHVSTVDHFHIYVVDPLIQLKLGMRNGQASDANKIKVLTGALLSTSELMVVLGHTSKADRSFNSNNTGQMLIPAEYIKDYNNDPVRWVIKAVILHLLIAMHSVRVLVNARSDAYIVTADRILAFMYEDHTRYDLDIVFRGLMQGYFLLHVSISQ